MNDEQQDRAHLAGLAMSALISRGQSVYPPLAANVAKAAVEYADELISQLAKTKPVADTEPPPQGPTPPSPRMVVACKHCDCSTFERHLAELFFRCFACKAPHSSSIGGGT